MPSYPRWPAESRVAISIAMQNETRTIGLDGVAPTIETLCLKNGTHVHIVDIFVDRRYCNLHKKGS
jgi:hypothetical protein